MKTVGKRRFIYICAMLTAFYVVGEVVDHIFGIGGYVAFCIVFLLVLLLTCETFE